MRKFESGQFANDKLEVDSKLTTESLIHLLLMKAVTRTEPEWQERETKGSDPGDGFK